MRLRAAAQSDNLIRLKRVTATRASRHFAEVLDAVEQDGETFVVTRGGRPVAAIGPTSGGAGRAVKEVLKQHRRDRSWESELARLRASLVAEERPWPG